MFLETRLTATLPTAPVTTLPLVSDRLLLGDLLDVAALRAAVADGLVRIHRHPVEPLLILDDTERAVFDREPAALGLGLDPQAPVEVTDKADGSLGVVYPTVGGRAVATRGAFASEQAVHATTVWRQRYAPQFTPPPCSTASP